MKKITLLFAAMFAVSALFAAENQIKLLLNYDFEKGDLSSTFVQPGLESDTIMSHGSTSEVSFAYGEVGDAGEERKSLVITSNTGINKNNYVYIPLKTDANKKVRIDSVQIIHRQDTINGSKGGTIRGYLYATDAEQNTAANLIYKVNGNNFAGDNLNTNWVGGSKKYAALVSSSNRVAPEVSGEYRISLGVSSGKVLWIDQIRVWGDVLDSTPTDLEDVETGMEVRTSANTLRVSLEEASNLTLYNVSGQVKETMQNVTEAQFTLPQGVYILTAQGKNENLVRKVSIQ